MESVWVEVVVLCDDVVDEGEVEDEEEDDDGGEDRVLVVKCVIGEESIVGGWGWVRLPAPPRPKDCFVEGWVVGEGS